MKPRIVMIAMALAVLLVDPRAAAAQSAAETPRIAVAAGAGIANPLHGDFEFTALAWETDVRVAMSRHALVEVAFGQWRHGQEYFGQETTYTQRTLEANVLATGAVDRVRFTGGGGVGLLTFHRRSRLSAPACSPQLPCVPFESFEFSNASGSAQAVGGAEVRVVGGLAAYGQVRFVMPFTDPGGSDLRFTAGLRFGFGR